MFSRFNARAVRFCAVVLAVVALAFSNIGTAQAYPGYTKSVNCLALKKDGITYENAVTLTVTWETEVGHPNNVRPRTINFTFNNASRIGSPFAPLYSLEDVEFTNLGHYTDIDQFGTLYNGSWIIDAYYSRWSANTRSFISKNLGPNVDAAYTVFQPYLSEWDTIDCQNRA